MFAVVIYFWQAWREGFFADRRRFNDAVCWVGIATLCTLALGGALKLFLEKVVLGGGKAEIEHLFSSLSLIAVALAAAGGLILVAAVRTREDTRREQLTWRDSAWIGLVQGVCIPFRGLSRSGSTISVGLLAGVGRRRAEEFSFALAVVLTPIAIAAEGWRLFKAQGAIHGASHLGGSLLPGLIGLGASFGAGLLALRLLSRWLEAGRWQYFGYYCLTAAGILLVLAQAGF